MPESPAPRSVDRPCHKCGRADWHASDCVYAKVKGVALPVLLAQRTDKPNPSREPLP